MVKETEEGHEGPMQQELTDRLFSVERYRLSYSTQMTYTAGILFAGAALLAVQILQTQSAPQLYCSAKNTSNIRTKLSYRFEYCRLAKKKKLINRMSMFIRTAYLVLITRIKFTTCTFHVHNCTELENKQPLAHNILDSSILCSLTFRHRASSTQDRHFDTLQRTLFIYLINKYI